VLFTSLLEQLSYTTSRIGFPAVPAEARKKLKP
jgi:hypothetical protein